MLSFWHLLKKIQMPNKRGLKKLSVFTSTLNWMSIIVHYNAIYIFEATC